jgi:hypothetical protein
MPGQLASDAGSKRLAVNFVGLPTFGAYAYSTLKTATTKYLGAR